MYGGAGRRAEQNYVTTGYCIRDIGSHKTLNNYTGVQKRWLGSGVISLLDSGAEGPGFKLQSRRYRVTVLGKLLTPIVPLFTKQQN